MASSSSSTQASTSLVRYSTAWSFSSAGISVSSKLAPSASPDQTIAFILMRSITPWKFDSAPIGKLQADRLPATRSTMSATHLKKSAPILSSC